MKPKASRQTHRPALVFAGLALVIGFRLAIASSQGKTTLEGVWLSSCQAGKISQMRIEANSTSYLREAFYKDSLCQTPQFFIETVGTLKYPESPLQTNYQFVDYTYQEIYLTALSEPMADQFNRQQLCDLSHWTALVPQRITGRQCRFVEGARPLSIPVTGQNRYGIFAIKEPWLYFGQNNPLENSSSPVRRPSELQKEPFGRRQP